VPWQTVPYKSDRRE